MVLNTQRTAIQLWDSKLTADRYDEVAWMLFYCDTPRQD